MTDQETLIALLTDLEDARKSHESAALAASEARKRETSALNTLNRLQKSADEVYAKLKAKAPRESDWNRSPTQRVSE